MIRVVLPAPLRTLAAVNGEIQVSVNGTATPRTILDAVEAMFPVLLGTIRDRKSGQRRPFIRFFVGMTDFSLEGIDVSLPATVESGSEPFIVIGAIAGG